MQRARVSPAIVGLYAARTVYDEDTRTVLLRQGTRLDHGLVRALLRHGITSLWVTNELLPDLEVNEVVSEETRTIARRALAGILGAVERQEEIRDEDLHQVQRVVRRMVDEILSNREVVVNIGHLRAWDEYTYQHSIQVAMLALLIGRHFGLSLEQLVRLGTGAILHDIGKVAVPKAILEKPGPLTEAEWEVMKSHVRVGWELVQDRPSILPTSAIVILQHHERLDGSGYPAGLKGEHIYPFAQITAVADVFDAMRADRVYRRRRKPAEVLATLRRGAGKLFDPHAVEGLFRRVALVPVGEAVRLSNGLLAVVVELNRGHPLQPKVAVVGDEQDRLAAQPEILDLKATDVVVEDILNEWPDTFDRDLRRRRR